MKQEEVYVSACAKLLALARFSDSAADLASKNADYRVPVPAVVLTDAAGVPIKIGDLRGKVVLLTFWTSNCAACDTEISWFREFQETYARRGLVFLDHHVVRGRDDDVARFFGGLNAIPTTFLIDRSGRIAVVIERYRVRFRNAVFRHAGLQNC
jgi:peroxiredoxin